MTYELVNRRTANSLASFASRDEATAALDQYRAADPDMAYDLMMVAFNGAGEAIEDPGEPTKAPKAERSFVG